MPFIISGDNAGVAAGLGYYAGKGQGDRANRSEAFEYKQYEDQQANLDRSFNAQQEQQQFNNAMQLQQQQDTRDWRKQSSEDMNRSANLRAQASGQASADRRYNTDTRANTAANELASRQQREADKLELDWSRLDRQIQNEISNYDIKLRQVTSQEEWNKIQREKMVAEENRQNRKMEFDSNQNELKLRHARELAEYNQGETNRRFDAGERGRTERFNVGQENRSDNRTLDWLYSRRAELRNKYEKLKTPLTDAEQKELVLLNHKIETLESNKKLTPVQVGTSSVSVPTPQQTTITPPPASSNQPTTAQSTTQPSSAVTSQYLGGGKNSQPSAPQQSQQGWPAGQATYDMAKQVISQVANSATNPGDNRATYEAAAYLLHRSGKTHWPDGTPLVDQNTGEYQPPRDTYMLKTRQELETAAKTEAVNAPPVGTTAVNRMTGQRIQFDGNKWIPIGSNQ